MTLADIEKTFIEEVSNNLEGKLFADLCGEGIIDKSDNLIIDYKENKVLLWGESYEKSFMNIISILALLRQLVDHHQIYVVNNVVSAPVLLLLSGKTITDIGIEEKRQYSAEQGNVTLCDPFGRPSLNGKELDTFKIIEGKIVEDLIVWLKSAIYPTRDLIELVENKFLTKEEIQFAATIRKTNWSIGIAIVAVIISIFSPIPSTEYSNRYGYSRIDSAQYDSIIEKLERIVEDKKCVYADSPSSYYLIVPLPRLPQINTNHNLPISGNPSLR